MRRRILLALPVLPVVLRQVQAQPVPREIEVIAQRFRFTPNVIRLKAGEPVVLQIKSLDFAHGFYVPDLDRRVDLMPGRVVSFAFTPAGPGTLHFLCDNFCGEGHEGMDGHFEISA